jgi:hypothetical protein
MPEESESEKALRLELERTKVQLSQANYIRESQAESHKQEIERIREASKFYNTDWFWLAFWILGPLILLGLGFNIG